MLMDQVELCVRKNQKTQIVQELLRIIWSMIENKHRRLWTSTILEVEKITAALIDTGMLNNATFSCDHHISGDKRDSSNVGVSRPYMTTHKCGLKHDSRVIMNTYASILDGDVERLTEAWFE